MRHERLARSPRYGSPDVGSGASTDTTVPDGRASAAGLLPAILLAGSAVVLFVFELNLPGYALLLLAVVLAFFIDRFLFRDLLLIAAGLSIISAVPITTDISLAHMFVMGTAMVLAVGIPYGVSRFGYRDHAVRFPVRTGQPWTAVEKWYLVAVVVIGYLLLPVYMMSTGVYQNWPAVSDVDGILRLFLGTNVLGIWDELFFICTCFALLRRHFPDWQANLLQAVLFTSFLFELGFHSWGPAMIFLFALVQGWIFKLTKSLSYIVCVHLLFDFVLFLVLVHAHNRAWLDIFLY
ncbi:CPBP family intramembrane glutamic endopeptidase [Arthrobacter sp. H14]|uniref:CPBP family intramembrane glutamic endopeptidase n=1 Tax=Arthrobacter sp. H14 TaxID=1312959 RepID=UPI0012DF9CC9|nr:CPBP family intramembrane glutamic endopeptidase [Arthrobacter sp. H14]